MPKPKDPDLEYNKIIRNFRIAVLVSLVTLATGAVFYHAVEKLSWLDAIYMCTITLTTVGYGDITPHTSAGKIFTIFYILVGIGIIATLINLTVKRAMAGRHHK